MIWFDLWKKSTLVFFFFSLLSSSNPFFFFFFFSLPLPYFLAMYCFLFFCFFVDAASISPFFFICLLVLSLLLLTFFFFFFFFCIQQRRMKFHQAGHECVFFPFISCSHLIVRLSFPPHSLFLFFTPRPLNFLPIFVSFSFSAFDEVHCLFFFCPVHIMPYHISTSTSASPTLIFSLSI